MSGPLSTVLAEIETGTPTVAEIVRHTHLSDDVVRAALDHLVRLGRVTAGELSVGCPDGGCGGCASATSCATGSGTRPALVTLTLTRHH